MMQTAAFLGTNFNLTGIKNTKGELAQYIGPTLGSAENLLSHLNKMPPTDRPEIFGIHQNAQGAVIHEEGESLLRKIYEYQF
jgi:hypothetical protein